MNGNELIVADATCVPSDANAVEVFIVRTFAFWPLLVFTFGSFVAIFDTSVYLILTTLLILFANYHYFTILGRAIGVPRPDGFDAEFCHAQPFALPDAKFVVAIVYTMLAVSGIVTHTVFRRRVSILRLAILIGFMLGYITSTIISRYFSWWLLASNMLIAVVTALAYWWLYWRMRKIIWHDANNTWRRHLITLAALLGAHVVLHRRRRQPKQQQAQQ